MNDPAIYDVIVVGGGSVGLSAAYYCGVNNNKKVLVLEKFEDFANAFGSSPGFTRQFRVCDSEKNLCKLGILTSPLWDNFMRDMNDDTLMKRTGFLWCDGFRGSSGKTVEEAVKNLKDFNYPEEDYKLYESKDQIREDFPFIAGAMDDVDGAKPKALFVKDGGTVNVPALIACLTEALRHSKNATLVTNAPVICIDYQFDSKTPGNIKVVAGEGEKARQYIGKKVILAPGTYVNEALSTLQPRFMKRINLNIDMLTCTYFELKNNAIDQMPAPCEWPVWAYVENDEPSRNISFYGLQAEDSQPNYTRVCPMFTSSAEFVFHDYPPSINKRLVDTDAAKMTSDFVEKSMPCVTPTLVNEKQTTCLVGFAELVDQNQADNGAGFVLDFIPGTRDKIVLYTGGWAMKYVPILGKILADLAIDGKTCEDYAQPIAGMSINRGILKEEAKSQQKEQRVTKITLSQPLMMGP